MASFHSFSQTRFSCPGLSPNFFPRKRGHECYFLHPFTGIKSSNIGILFVYFNCCYSSWQGVVFVLTTMDDKFVDDSHNAQNEKVEVQHLEVLTGLSHEQLQTEVYQSRPRLKGKTLTFALAFVAGTGFTLFGYVIMSPY